MRFSVLLLFVAICLAVLLSCSDDASSSNGQIETISGLIQDEPLKNVVIEKQSCDPAVFYGTYSVTTYGDQTRFYYVSFCDDGTMIYTPAVNLLSPIDDTCHQSTWEFSSSTAIKFSLFGNSYDSTMKDFVSKDTGAKIGFYLTAANTSKNIYFTKVSDCFINTEIYTNRSLLYDCIWATEDDYGNKKGYGFTSSGIRITYKYENGSSSSYNTNYQLATQYTKMNLDTTASFGAEYNYTLIGDYLYIGLSGYKCLGKSMPLIGMEESVIKDRNLRSDLYGVWIILDSNNNTIGFLDFDRTGRVFKVCSDYKGDGVWTIDNCQFSFTFPDITKSYSINATEYSKTNLDNLYLDIENGGHLLKMHGSTRYILGKDYDVKNPKYPNSLLGCTYKSEQLYFNFGYDGIGVAGLVSGNNIDLLNTTWYCSQDEKNLLYVTVTDTGTKLVDGYFFATIRDSSDYNFCEFYLKGHQMEYLK